MTTAEPEVIDVEEVDPAEPSVEIERVAAPVPMPTGPSPLAELSTIPEARELQTLAQLATTFAYSQLVPKPLQGRPEDVLLVLLTARDLGLSATVALRECHPIDGRVTVSPKLRMAIVRQRQLGRIWPAPDNDEHHHTWNAARADDPQTVYSVRYTWQDAVRAGMVQAACTPDDHSQPCLSGTRGKSCKSNWRTYPGQMLQWRAIGYLMDQAFGEVGVGLYSADELGAVTDEDGRIVDVMEVGPLDGMPDRSPAPPEPGTDPNETVEEEVRDAFKARIGLLPPPAIDVLREQWARRTDPNGPPMILPLRVLPRRQVKAAEALIAGFEKRAASGEWGPWSPAPAGDAENAHDSDPKGGRSAGEPEEPPVGPVDGTGAESAPPADPVPDAQPDPDVTPDAPPPYDPSHPPSSIVEAAIDRANSIPDDELDEALVATSQTPVSNHKPDTKRKRLVRAWFYAGWTPEGWSPTEADVERAE